MIQRKKKICKECGKETYIWAYGRCKECDAKHKASNTSNKTLQPSSKPLSRKSNTNIPPRVKKLNTTTIWLQNHWGFRSQVEMFKELWEVSPEVCRFTGEKLGKYRDTDMWVNCCAHILPKGKFPLYRLNIENVLLVYPEFHRIVDQGTQKERNEHPEWRFDLWDLEVAKKKKEYEQFKKSYLL